MKKFILYISILLSIFSCSSKEILTPQEVNETVFVGSGDSNFYALDAQTGIQKWIFTGNSGMNSSAISDGIVYVHEGSSILYALNISDGSKQWEFKTSSIIRNSPFINKGTLYTAMGGSYSLVSRMYVLDSKTGT